MCLWKSVHCNFLMKRKICKLCSLTLHRHWEVVFSLVPIVFCQRQKGKREKLFLKFNITWRKRCLWTRCEVNTNFMHYNIRLPSCSFGHTDTIFLPIIPYPSRVICITLYVEINISRKHLFWRDGSDTHVHTPPSIHQCYQSSLEVRTVLYCFIILIQMLTYLLFVTSSTSIKVF